MSQKFGPRRGGKQLLPPRAQFNQLRLFIVLFFFLSFFLSFFFVSSSSPISAVKMMNLLMDSKKLVASRNPPPTHEKEWKKKSRNVLDCVSGGGDIECCRRFSADFPPRVPPAE